MIIKVIIFTISLAAIYHAYTFAAWLSQNGNKSGAKGVYAFILLALGLAAI